MIDELIKTLPTQISVTREQGIDLLYKMLLIRRFEEKAAEMYTKSKIRGFLHLYIGEEAVSVGVLNALTSNDNILTTYRSMDMLWYVVSIPDL